MNKIVIIERETLERAIDALELHRGGYASAALESLRAALAEPKCSPTLTECPRCKNNMLKCGLLDTKTKAAGEISRTSRPE